MQILYLGSDARRAGRPATRVVQDSCIIAQDVSLRDARLTVHVPHKEEMDRAKSTFPSGGVSPGKEWLARHVAYGLSLIHERNDAYSKQAILALDICTRFHVREGWDGMSLMTSNGSALLVVTLNRQKPPNKFSAEWRFYRASRAASSDLLLGGGCGYDILIPVTGDNGL